MSFFLNFRHVSTFWIAHPNNTFVNNSAAGSQASGLPTVGTFFCYSEKNIYEYYRAGNGINCDP